MNLSSNGIAQQLHPDSLQRLQDICSGVELQSGQVLEPVGSNTPQVYFLIDATACLWMQAAGGTTPRLAMSAVGSEGLAGCSHLWPSSPCAWTSQVIKPGQACQAPAAQVLDLLDQLPDLSAALSRFLWVQTLEIAQLSARMQLGDVRTRLALWLHLLQRKTGQRVLRITHQALSDMTGIRRVSITLCAGQLQDEGVLALRRGYIEILDLPALAKAAGLSASA